MIEDEQIWSVDDHLRHGEATIGKILPIGIEQEDCRVCFHLTPIDYDEDEPWTEEASYNQRAKPLFDTLGFKFNVDYVGGTSGIEAWETVIPSIEWLHSRVPMLVDLASRAGLQFDGWSLEPLMPREASFVSCGPTLDVVNRYSPEGQRAIDELFASTSAPEG